MPIYEYKCEICNHRFEELLMPGEKEPERCPECGNKSIRRMWTGSVGLVFKGSGFYITDYARKENKNKKQEKDKGKTCSPDGKCKCK